MKTTSLIAVPLALAAAVAGPSALAAGPVAIPAASRTVLLKNIALHPAVLHITRGTTVVWRWGDASLHTEHNVTSTSGRRFRSSPTQISGTWSIRFTARGTYRYECTVHPSSMNGTIVVR